MNAYTLDFKWHLGENSGKAKRVVFAHSEEAAKWQFSEANIDCVVLRISMIPESAEVIHNLILGKPIIMWSNGDIKQSINGHFQRNVPQELFFGLLKKDLITPKRTEYPATYEISPLGKEILTIN